MGSGHPPVAQQARKREDSYTYACTACSTVAEAPTSVATRCSTAKSTVSNLHEAQRQRPTIEIASLEQWHQQITHV